MSRMREVTRLAFSPPPNHSSNLAREVFFLILERNIELNQGTGLESNESHAHVTVFVMKNHLLVDPIIFVLFLKIGGGLLFVASFANLGKPPLY